MPRGDRGMADSGCAVHHHCQPTAHKFIHGAIARALRVDLAVDSVYCSWGISVQLLPRPGAEQGAAVHNNLIMVRERSMKQVKSFCRMCGSACGTVLTLDDDNHLVKVRPDDANPMSRGYLCY